ncbi:hypothetical protein [Marinifilum flexuosum]|uniref:hypothetical protein n=1 Tax=Marinifilum flexuosum TaxID=1117708 RepID=UPI002493DE0A|nr:hypothetical protein [Marinifilum flexuosum]
MKKIGILLFVTNFIFLSCCTLKRNNSIPSDSIAEKLKGYWVSTNKHYEIDEPESERKILFYGETDKNQKGLYLQEGKEMQYRIVKIDEANNKIDIGIQFTKTRERIETLTFSKDFDRIKNNIVTPDGFSIDTYYIRKK